MLRNSVTKGLYSEFCKSAPKVMLGRTRFSVFPIKMNFQAKIPQIKKAHF